VTITTSAPVEREVADASRVRSGFEKKEKTRSWARLDLGQGKEKPTGIPYTLLRKRERARASLGKKKEARAPRLDLPPYPRGGKEATLLFLQLICRKGIVAGLASSCSKIESRARCQGWRERCIRVRDCPQESGRSSRSRGV